jgi:hypothetical protein
MEIYKKKFRWLAKITNANKEQIFEGFIRVAQRPSFTFPEREENGVYFAEFEKGEWSKFDFVIFEDNVNTEVIKTAKNIELTLCDGCGDALERWISEDFDIISVFSDLGCTEISFKPKSWYYNNEKLLPKQTRA